MMKVGRNSPCPCGSGKKYKRCCEVKKAEMRKTSCLVAASATSPGGTASLSERPLCVFDGTRVGDCLAI
jgi:hypothetical protein